MFQNIQDETIKKTKDETKVNILTNAISKKYILLYIVTLMVSMIGMGQEIAPFSLAIVAACISNEVAIAAILVIALIGNAIGIGASSVLNYILTILVFFASFFLAEPKYNEESRNEKVKLALRVFLASLIINAGKVIITDFTLYDILVAVTFSITTTIFYKIFVNSIVVLKDYDRVRAFSIEEVIGASLTLAIAVCSFGDLEIMGFSIRNVLSIFIVLVLGWKNGILVGTTTGVTIGVTLGIIANNEPITVAAYAISGMIAGILKKFGKIGVIVGFIVGDGILSYISNGGVHNLIVFKEILIAGIGLLAVPKNINLKLENIIGENKFLPVSNNRGLNRSKETIEKLNNVSKAVKEMAENYKSVAATVVDENDIKEKNKQTFIAELLNNIDNMEDNILYEYISDVEGKIVEDIFEKLLDKQFIDEKDLIKILAKNNNYVIGFEEEEKQVEEEISKMVQAINSSYRIGKMNFIWSTRLKEEKGNVGSQLQGVSKAISDIAKDLKTEIKNEEKFQDEKEQIMILLKQKEILVQEISINQKADDRFIVEIYTELKKKEEEKEIISNILAKVLKEKMVLTEEKIVEEEKCSKYVFVSDDKFMISIGYSTKTKENMPVSGDSTLQIKLKDGKYLLAISDGMGSGVEARKSSQIVTNMLKRLLNSGFEKTTSIELINSSLLNVGEDVFATLDIAIIDLYKGNIEFIKSGACPTYIKNKKKVQMIKSLALPTGIVEDAFKDVFDKDIENNDIVLMCSDGILDSNIEFKNKELWVKYMLEDMENTDVQKIADIILNEAIDNNYGKIKDDMTVLACKFIKK